MNERILEATSALWFLGVLQGYHTLMEAQLQDAHVLERALYLLGKDDTKDLESPELELKLSSIDFQYQHRFVYILRYSVITSAYSIFEQALHDLCEFTRKKLDKPRSLSDIDRKRGEIKRFKTYMRRSGVDVTAIGNWQFFAHVTKVRNAIVHATGWLYERQPEDARHINNLRSVIGKLKGISLKEDGLDIELCVEKSFCDQLIANIETAIDDIYEAICCQIRPKE